MHAAHHPGFFGSSPFRTRPGVSVPVQYVGSGFGMKDVCYLLVSSVDEGEGMAAAGAGAGGMGIAIITLATASLGFLLACRVAAWPAWGLGFKTPNPKRSYSLNPKPWQLDKFCRRTDIHNLIAHNACGPAFASCFLRHRITHGRGKGAAVTLPLSAGSAPAHSRKV